MLHVFYYLERRCSIPVVTFSPCTFFKSQIKQIRS